MIFTWRKEEIIFKRIHLIMIGLALMLSSYIITINPENRLYIALGCSLYFALAFFRHLFLSNQKSNILQWLFPYLEGIVLYIVLTMDISQFGSSLFILAVWDIAIDYKTSYGIVYSIFGYFIYMLTYANALVGLTLTREIALYIIGAFQFALYIGFAFLAKDYSIKTRELRLASSEILAKMISLKEMTVLKERNRIAVDIHNTIGHQLTTALVQIEATQMMMNKDFEEGKKRLVTVKDQIRKGLHVIRNTIQAINLDEQYTHFSKAVQNLLDQIDIHTKIHVKTNMDCVEETKLQLKKTMYHIIQESVTNAIRHSDCNNIRIDLKNEQGLIKLSCYNDGFVVKPFNFGFGLTQMKENVEAFGGSFEIKLDKENSFGLEVKLPVYQREADIYEEN